MTLLKKNKMKRKALPVKKPQRLKRKMIRKMR